MSAKESKALEDEDGLSLLGALSQLKEDILKLQEQSRKTGAPSLFLIQEGELELKLVARREIKGDAHAQGKFRLFLCDATAKASVGGELSHEHVQTLKIKFRGLDSHPSVLKDGSGGSVRTIGFPTNPSPGPVIQTDPSKNVY